MGVWQAYSCSPNCSLSVLLIPLFQVHVSFSRCSPCEVANTRANPPPTHTLSCTLAWPRWQGPLMVKMWTATSNPGPFSQRDPTDGAWKTAPHPTHQAFIFQTFSINQLKCWQQHGKLFKSVLRGGRLRLHLADKGACLSLLDPHSLVWLVRENASFIYAEHGRQRWRPDQRRRRRESKNG